MKKALVVAATAGFLHAFLENDMKILQSLGYEVHCAANKNAVKFFEVESNFATLGVQFHQINFSSSSPISKETVESVKQFRKLNKEYNFDVIHCHTPIAGAIVRLCSASCRKNGSKVIYTSHGLAFTKNSGIKSWLIYGVAELLCSCFTDAIITINKQDYTTAKKMFCKNVYHINGVGVDTSKYHNLEIDTDAYRQSIGVEKDELMILSVGELSQRKNHQIIIKAISRIKSIKCVYVICGKAMVGSGTYDQLQSLASELGVKVLFLGFRKDIPQINHCADIAALPSTREGLGLAGIEALASGVPVVGTDIQGIKDYVIDGETGFLCDVYDDKGFAEKIEILSNAEVRKNMYESCIAKAEEFSTNISFKQMETIYKQILT